MKKEIRLMLDGKKSAPRITRMKPRRIAEPVVAQTQTPRRKMGRPLASVSWITDQQTKEELAEREIAAKVAAYRQQQRIAQAKPTSEKCSRKACPYPAVLEGECRKHALDRIATSSEFGSTLAIAASMAHILYC
jgi:hypothetical protein